MKTGSGLWSTSDRRATNDNCGRPTLSDTTQPSVHAPRELPPIHPDHGPSTLESFEFNLEFFERGRYCGVPRRLKVLEQLECRGVPTLREAPASVANFGANCLVGGRSLFRSLPPLLKGM